MELFSPDIVEPHRPPRRPHRARRHARATAASAARRSCRGFTTELPALAITLRDGDVRMDAQPDGSARISGSVRSGDGTLNVDGTLGWRGDDTPLVLNVRGSNVLASDTRDLRAVIDPDVTVRYAAGPAARRHRHGRRAVGAASTWNASTKACRRRRRRGRARSGRSRSAASPRRSTSTSRSRSATTCSSTASASTARLGGRLRVRARPGREMTANGTLDVDGRYTAYGQKLDITRGELAWIEQRRSPIPSLDIRAEREVGDVTAGIDVSGRATVAAGRGVGRTRRWTQSEALAYLALGRPLSSASGDEGRQLDAASAALSAGGSLLASQLGARIGLDDAGVMQSRALGGSVFGVGKYLSPRLYVGYGVSLLGTGQVLTLKYLLRKGFDIEIESSTVENRALGQLAQGEVAMAGRASRSPGGACGNRPSPTPRFATPADVVRWFGAMQAQDYLGALWAVGLRMRRRDAGHGRAGHRRPPHRPHLADARHPALRRGRRRALDAGPAGAAGDRPRPRADRTRFRPGCGDAQALPAHRRQGAAATARR